MNNKVIKWLYKDNQTRNSGTIWELWGGHGTAHHVYAGARNNIPYFANGPVKTADGLIDVVLFGVTLAKTKPREPVEGEAIKVYGYPAGSGTLECRLATVYYHRKETASKDYSVPSWIGKIDSWKTPYKADSTLFDSVYGGMSGGLVSAEDGEPLGFLVTQNGLADLDSDGKSDDSFDFVSLADVWEVYNDTLVSD